MRIRNLEGYATCVHSRKRTQAPWRVNSGCENRVRLFTGKHYELPNSSICCACPFYCEEKGKTDQETIGRSPPRRQAQRQDKNNGRCQHER